MRLGALTDDERAEFLGPQLDEITIYEVARVGAVLIIRKGGEDHSLAIHPQSAKRGPHIPRSRRP